MIEEEFKKAQVINNSMKGYFKLALASLTRENDKRGVISVLRFFKSMQKKEINNHGETPWTPQAMLIL